MRSYISTTTSIFLIVLFWLGASACDPLTTLPQPPVSATATQPETSPPSGSQPPASETVIPLPTETPLPADTPAPIFTPTPATIRFAVIGDYGAGGQAEADVASLVKSWNPDFIITTGDNNYPDGAAETIDQNIGQFYHEFIYPYKGGYGPGADHIRFFPSLGNHDWSSPGAQPYLEYFELPGNERYYDFTWEPVYFVVIDSDSREPDGVSRASVQAEWLQARLAGSNAAWNVVYFHHPPFSSGTHGPVDWMRWPFAEWGASVVLAGHDHIYERLLIDGIPYFTNGVGGGAIYSFPSVSEGSQMHYNADYGAMLVTADAGQMTFQFINRRGETIDSYQISNGQ